MGKCWYCGKPFDKVLLGQHMLVCVQGVVKWRKANGIK